jgi:hypothetical protein
MRQTGGVADVHRKLALIAVGIDPRADQETCSTATVIRRRQSQDAAWPFIVVWSAAVTAGRLSRK